MPPNEGLSAHFKLKWLEQSRDAPSDASRCRTCAINTSRGNRIYFCPLNLASEKLTIRFTALVGIFGKFLEEWTGEPWDPEKILSEQYPPKWETEFSRFQAFFFNEGGNFIRLLRTLQEHWDSKGVLAETIDPQLPLAMTVRDCTLFLQFPKDGQKPIEARLGDLDIKLTEKIPEWQAKESALLKELWYLRDAPLRNRCFLAAQRGHLLPKTEGGF
ncbi:MAG: Inositol-pentakisphosphate 2-kinase [Bathelium mastoideum]|nr:MAG: Inositol-pentakisphosphate 2-kinase [Bathelium mastoideum]